MARRPIEHGDQNSWGDRWEEYENVSRNSDGTLISAAITSSLGYTPVNPPEGAFEMAERHGFSTAASATANANALASAVDSAVGTAGAKVLLPPGVFNVEAGNATLTAALTDTEGVRIIGAGSQNSPYGATLNQGTILKATSGAGAILSWVATGTDSLRGNSIEGVSLDGNGVASVGLHLSSIYMGRFIGVHIRNTTSVGLEMTSVSGSGTGCQGNYFESLSIRQTAAAAKGMTLDGFHAPAGTNVSGNRWINYFVYTQNGTGIELGYADNNAFYSGIINRSGTAIAIDFLASNTANESFENLFYHVDCVGPIIARGTPSGSSPSRDNWVFFSNDDSPDLVPTEEAGATLHWETMGGVRFPEYRQLAQAEDDFVSGNSTSGSIGSMGWNTAGGTFSQVAGEVSHPGIVRLDTTAGAGTFSRMFLWPNGTGLFNCQEAFDMTFYIRLNTNDADTQVRVGLVDLSSGDPTAGLYFEKLYGDVSWFGVTRTGGVQTRSAAIAATTAGWVTLRIRRRFADCGFSINGSTETVMTAGATMPGGALSPCVQIKNQAAASKTVDVDYFSLLIQRLTRA